MPSTIKDVARKANVSTATVSLVLHNHKRISTNTRNKVLKAVAELDYRPSRLARSLVLRETKNIGFLLTNDHFLRTEPFYTHIFLGTEFEARDHKYYVLLNTIPSLFEGENCQPRFVKEKNVDGIIIAGKVPEELISCLIPYNLPLVYVDFYPAVGKHHAVMIDNLEGGKKATEYLASLGHRKIAFLGGDLDHPSIRERFNGYRVAMENLKIPYDNKSIITSESSTSREGGAHATAELLKKNKNITAIFASNDAMALGAIDYIKSRGLKVPGDISVIGFDDVETGLDSDPPLTTMRVPKIELGSQAMKMMVDVLKDQTKKPHKILISAELIERDSTRIL
jgi:LacI family transcriptional regulator